MLVMQNLFGWIIAGVWIFWIAYWIASARGVKKDTNRERYWQNAWWLRILLVAAVLLALQFSGVRVREISIAGGSMIVGGIGIALLIVGLFFAIWARRHLGRNWSNRPALKEGHELITSGPYRIVRHPIYAGVLAGILGSALAEGGIWAAAFVVAAIIFIWRIPIEERIMTQQFPDRYSEYKKNTKALIPFVW